MRVGWLGSNRLQYTPILGVERDQALGSPGSAGTEDADATLATITRLGGSVIRPAEDTPYGRLAEAADPTGVHFKLVAPNAAMPARES